LAVKKTRQILEHNWLRYALLLCSIY